MKINGDAIRKRLESYILSLSGWRAVIAVSGNEDDMSPEVSPADLAIAYLAAGAFFEFLDKPGARILVGRDTRSTGENLLSAASSALSSLGADVVNIDIASSPEIMAYSNEGFDGFFYVTASHNPAGHNGFKVGRNGGVLKPSESADWKDIFLSSIPLSLSFSSEGVSFSPEEKEKALRYYSSFVLRTASVENSSSVPFSVACDFNGSARAFSIDRSFFPSIGIGFKAMNEDKISHGIIPEGKNLNPLASFLSSLHDEDPSFVLGYMPDNDGDRGNFVYIDESGKAAVMGAQEVFSLIFTIEAANACLKGIKRKAVAVNSMTSLRVDEIAALFGFEVFRSDVGEANVVSLSDNLRNSGYFVPVSGEGSNGGVIAHPSKVRDPMDSVMTVSKIFRNDGLFALLRDKLGIQETGNKLSALIRALPSYVTTASSSPQAVLKGSIDDFVSFKRRYLDILLSEIGEKFSDFEIKQYDGPVEISGIEIEKTDGALRTVLISKGRPVGFLSVSKSRTENILRLMVDIKGSDTEKHDELLEWNRSIAERAIGR